MSSNTVTQEAGNMFTPLVASSGEQHDEHSLTGAARKAILIPDDTVLQKSKQFLYPAEYEDHLEGVLIPFQDIADRILVLARAIGLEYKGKRPMIVCVLKGASVFYNNLLLALSQQRITYTMEFIRAKCSMKNNEEGSVEISGLDLTKVKNRHVIVVEDVVISGGTLSHVVAVLKAAGSISLKVCALLDKRITAEKRLKNIDYVGFSVPNLFLVGHGLDYADSYRECADIWVLSSLGKEKKGKIY